MRLLVTGGCGFIGSNLIRLLLAREPEVSITNLDALTYAGNPANLAGVAEEFNGRYHFCHGDIGDRTLVANLLRERSFDAVLNLAAESHVDRSIHSPENFIHANVVGTSVLLECARAAGIPRFVQVSTDEVYGSLGATGLFTESSPLQPSSPYSASKAGADLLALASHHTYGQEVIVTRCSNNYGRYQFPEKLIPLMVLNALRDLPLPVYGDGQNVRDWIHVDDHCTGIWAALRHGKPGEVYNLGASNEQPNLTLVRTILDLVGKSYSLIRFVTDRLGHDRRYAIDSTKTRTELGWQPAHSLAAGLRETVQWYVENRAWWEPLLVKHV